MRPFTDWEIVGIIFVLVAWGLLWGLDKLCDMLFALPGMAIGRWRRLRRKNNAR